MLALRKDLTAAKGCVRQIEKQVQRLKEEQRAGTVREREENKGQTYLQELNRHTTPGAAVPSSSGSSSSSAAQNSAGAGNSSSSSTLNRKPTPASSSSSSSAVASRSKKP
jgi:hypothetical protein